MSVSTCLPVDCGGSGQLPDWIHCFSGSVCKTELKAKIHPRNTTGKM